MSEKEHIDHLLNSLTERTKIRIQQALEWARKYALSSISENNSRQIAALVFLYESANHGLSWKIGNPLCNMDTAERNYLISWLRNTFVFNKQEVYDAFKIWMKTGSPLGCYIAHGMNSSYEMMQEAAYYGDNDLLDWLLSRDVDVDFRDSFKNTALHVAATEGRTSTVKFLLKQGASILVLNSQLKSPFDLALDSNHFDVCDILCPTAIGKMISESMITDAVEEGNCSKLLYLLEKNGWMFVSSALLQAVESGYPHIVEKLLRESPKSYTFSFEIYEIVLNCPFEKYDINIIEKLVAAGVRIKDSEGKYTNKLIDSGWFNPKSAEDIVD